MTDAVDAVNFEEGRSAGGAPDAARYAVDANFYAGIQAEGTGNAAVASVVGPEQVGVDVGATSVQTVKYSAVTVAPQVWDLGERDSVDRDGGTLGSQRGAAKSEFNTAFNDQREAAL